MFREMHVGEKSIGVSVPFLCRLLFCSVKNAFNVVTSTSTEELSLPCHNQWFDTVSTN